MTRQAVGPALLFAAGLLVASVTDLRSRRIRNWTTLPLLASGIAYNAAVGGALRGLAGAATGLGLLFIPFLLRLIAGGDVKLLAAVGAWLGASAVLWVALGTALLAGLFALVLLVRDRALAGRVRTNLTGMLLTRSVLPVEERPRSQALPIGAAIAAAALWVAFPGRGFPLA